MDCMRRPGLGQHRATWYVGRFAWKLMAGRGSGHAHAHDCCTERSARPSWQPSAQNWIWHEAEGISTRRIMGHGCGPSTCSWEMQRTRTDGSVNRNHCNTLGVNKYAYRIRFPKLGNCFT